MSDIPPLQPWLSEKAQKWGTAPLKFLLSRRAQKGHGDRELLSVYRDHGVVPKSSRDDNFNRAGKDLDAYLWIRPGDLVINKMKAWQGSVAVSDHDGIVSPAYFSFAVSESVHGRYLHHLLRSQPFIDEFRRISKGVRPNQWDLDIEVFMRLEAPLPPRSIQQAIADFLDRKTATIDELIAKKERQIELLQEQRQALISQAVTKGLDPNVAMKDSGIEWLGQIPEHWGVAALKRIARPGYKTFTDGDWIESPYITDDGIRLLQTGNVGIGEFREKGFRYVSEATFAALRCTEVRPGDVLVCRLDGPVGRACLAPDLGVKLITSVDNAILKTRADVDARFIVYFLSQRPYLDWVQALCRVGGGHRFRISRTMLGDFQVATPPHFEQVEIADMLDEQTSSLAAAVAAISRHVELLQEYRQALVTEAVTGKLDISKAGEVAA